MLTLVVRATINVAYIARSIARKIVYSIVCRITRSITNTRYYIKVPNLLVYILPLYLY